MEYYVQQMMRIPLDEAAAKWHQLLLGLETTAPERACVTIQVLENSKEQLDCLPDDAPDRATEFNRRYLNPIIRTVVPNLAAWDLADVSVFGLAEPFGMNFYLDRRATDAANGTSFFMASEVFSVVTCALARPEPLPESVDLHVFGARMSQLTEYFSDIAAKARVAIDQMAAESEIRPLGLYLHSFYFTSLQVLSGSEQEGVDRPTLMARMALRRSVRKGGTVRVHFPEKE